MNERIKELAEQAGFGEQWFEEHPTGCSLPKPLMLKEYTELIVRECAEVARLNTRVDSKVYLMIQEHFGVDA